MGSAIGTWFADTRSVYFGNATAVRDYRVQLRGMRSVMLFGIYLIVLIGVAMMNYASAESMSRTTLVDAQFTLRNFYSMTMTLLGVVVVLVSTGITATTIVMERQRQSIDLVFSAPVSPKYYLVGKMISSYRYTWMLLVLSLPVTAASVVLGGASWSEVLAAYFRLSMQGLMFTAFALLISATTTKAVSAITWSYITAGIVNLGLAALGAASALATRFGGRGLSEAPFWVELSPFNFLGTAQTYTTIGGVHVPNYILVGVFSLLVVKICLLGAGSLLNPSGGKEIVGLRIYGFVYLLAIFAAAGYVTGGAFSWVARFRAGSPSIDEFKMTGMVLAWSTMPLAVFIPFISCYGFDRQRRLKPNGLFSLRHILDGTPAGGLPYIVALIAAIYGGVALGARSILVPEFWSFAAYAMTFWVFFWALGRFISSFSNNLSTSRTLLFTLFLAIVALPYPIIVVVSGVDAARERSGLWNYYILEPVISSYSIEFGRQMLWGAILLSLSLLLVAVSETRTRKVLSGIRDYDEQPA